MWLYVGGGAKNTDAREVDIVGRDIQKEKEDPVVIRSLCSVTVGAN
jgi:hypothetical protein